MPALVLTLLAAATLAPGAASIDPDAIDRVLLEDIGRIRVIDTHTHASAFTLPPEDEPQAPRGSTSFDYPLRLRLDNPEYLQAARALWGAVPAGADDVARATLRLKWRARREKAEEYPAWVLDQAGIELALVNTGQLGAGLVGPRFRWVPFGDELLFPIKNKGASFRRFLSDSGLTQAPPSLSGYVARVLIPTLLRWKAAGAVAVKLGVAYQRGLDFASAAKADAERAYARGVTGAALQDGERKTLEDYLFRVLCAEAGRLELVVNIHTGVGVDAFFDIAGARPALLEPALNDPALRATRFVLVHGGWPYERETGALLMKPNVYVDFSAQTLMRSTRAVAETLRAWLEWYPERVLFGSDAFSESPTSVEGALAGWEERTWLATRTSREALALALTGMMKDGQLTRAQAVELARLVLRGNAERLYGLGSR